GREGACLCPRGARAMVRPMRAFVCEVDHHGLRRLLPEDLLPPEELLRLARGPAPRQTAVVWALLHDPDSEALRAEVDSGRHHDACGLLLNRAVELLPVGAAVPETACARLTVITPTGAERPGDNARSNRAHATGRSTSLLP